MVVRTRGWQIFVMRRPLALVFGGVVYGLFGLAWLYFIGFLGGFPVPKDVDSGAAASVPISIAIDLGALAIFFAHHSVLARRGVKQAIARLVPPVVERSVYVLTSTLALGAVMALWRPLPDVVWQAKGAARAVTLVVFWTGVLVALTASHMIDGLELFGVRQVLAYFRRRQLERGAFRTPGLYRIVRHPMMTGILLSLWSTPTMTQGRLLLAAAMSAYIVVAVKWLEERDLRATFGEKYERYQEDVPMLLPLRAGRRPSKSPSAQPSPPR